MNKDTHWPQKVTADIQKHIKFLKNQTVFHSERQGRHQDSNVEDRKHSAHTHEHLKEQYQILLVLAQKIEQDKDVSEFAHQLSNLWQFVRSQAKFYYSRWLIAQTLQFREIESCCLELKDWLEDVQYHLDETQSAYQPERSPKNLTLKDEARGGETHILACFEDHQEEVELGEIMLSLFRKDVAQCLGRADSEKNRNRLDEIKKKTVDLVEKLKEKAYLENVGGRHHLYQLTEDGQQVISTLFGRHEAQWVKRPKGWLDDQQPTD